MLELRDPQRVPVLLSAVAGYIDSCTFLGLFGLFVAQVTGSFVVAGAQWVTDDPGFLIKVLGIPFFLLGGVVTTVVVATATARGGSGYSWAFGLEGILLVCFLGIGVATTVPRTERLGGVGDRVLRPFGDGRAERSGAAANEKRRFDQRHDDEHDAYCNRGHPDGHGLAAEPDHCWRRGAQAPCRRPPPTHSPHVDRIRIFRGNGSRCFRVSRLRVLVRSVACGNPVVAQCVVRSGGAQGAIDFSAMKRLAY
jgi:hypothetical protein